MTSVDSGPVRPGAHLPEHPDFLWRNPEPKKSYDVSWVSESTFESPSQNCQTSYPASPDPPSPPDQCIRTGTR